jgi:hypothetical protein
VKQAPSWEADISTATQKLPSLYGIEKFIILFTRHRRLLLL